MRTILSAGFVIALLIAPTSALAQTRYKVDVAASVSRLTDSHMPELSSSVPNGPFAGVALEVAPRINAHVAVVGEFGASSLTHLDFYSYQFPGSGIFTEADRWRVRIYSAMGGIRFRARGTGPVTPLVQCLVGVVQVRVGHTYSTSSGGSSFDSPAKTHFTVQPGIGADVRLTRRFSARVQGDYRPIRVEDYQGHGVYTGSVQSELRLSTGVVLALR